MQNEVLILIDLENTNLDYVIEKIKNINCEYSAYAFCDFTIHCKNITANLFYDYNIKPVQVFHQKNKKNNADFVLLRYAYSHIFQNKKLKHIYLFSSDGDYADLCYFIKQQDIALTISNSKPISSSLQSNTNTSKEINLTSCLDKSNSMQKINIIKEEYIKTMQSKNDKNQFIKNVRTRIPELNKQSILQTFSFINNCNNFDDIIIYCKKTIICDTYNANKNLPKDKLWHKIRPILTNKNISISSIFPNQNIKTVKQLLEYAFKN